MEAERLVDACRTLRSIDTGDYPFRHYSSGEISGTKRVHTKSGWEDRDVYAELPIFPEGNMKGLRFGLTHTIFHIRQEFERWGIKETAERVIVDFRKNGEPTTE